MKTLQIIFIALIIVACNQTPKNTINESKETPKDFVFATWTGADKVFDKATWEEKLGYYKSIGITEVLINANADVLEQIMPLANQRDLKIHAWMWTLNRPNDTIAN